MVCGCILLFPIFDDLSAWFAIRFVLGVALTGVFVVSEAWIIQIAGAHARGRVLGLYAAILSAGFSIGPLLIRVTGIEGWLPFAVSAGIVGLAVIPVMFARADAPKFGGDRKLPLTGFVRLAPVAICAALIFGAAETCILSLLPSYGLRHGLNAESAATLLAITGAGSIALQIPIGWLSDRFNRLWVLLFCALVGLSGVALLPALINAEYLLWAMLFVWGGVIVGLYTVGLALLSEYVDATDLAAANAAFIQAYGFGAIMGPALAGAAMSAAGPDGLPLSLGLLFAGFMVFAVVRGRGAEVAGT